jgi:hypothetical protein
MFILLTINTVLNKLSNLVFYIAELIVSFNKFYYTRDT